MLVQILFYPHACLNASTLRHAVVKEYELVRVALSAVSLFDPVDGLIAIGGCIALDRELHEEALQRDSVERVVVYDEDRRLRMPVVLLVSQHQLDGLNLLATLTVADRVIIILLAIVLVIINCSLLLLSHALVIVN